MTTDTRSPAEDALRELAVNNVRMRLGQPGIVQVAYSMADYMAVIVTCVEHPEWARWWYQEFKKMEFLSEGALEQVASTIIEALSIAPEEGERGD